MTPRRSSGSAQRAIVLDRSRVVYDGPVVEALTYIASAIDHVGAGDDR